MTEQQARDAVREPVRVLLVDDQAIVRKGIGALLAQIPSIELVGEAVNGQDAVDRVDELDPDVIVMDLTMPVMDGIEATTEILARRPEARILVLTSFSGAHLVVPAIRAGALGYLLKDSEPAHLVYAIEQASRGELTLDPGWAAKLVKALEAGPGRPRAFKGVSSREVTVLRLVAAGLSNHEIAEWLEMSEETVRGHVGTVLGRLDHVHRTLAALYAIQEGQAPAEGGAPQAGEP